MSGDREWPAGHHAQVQSRAAPNSTLNPYVDNGVLLDGSPAAAQSSYSHTASAGVSSQSGTVTPSNAAPYQNMIGSSIPPQPTPYPERLVQEQFNQQSQLDQQSAYEFDRIPQRQQQNFYASYQQQFPNMHALDRSNVGGNVHPSDLYSYTQFMGPYPTNLADGTRGFSNQAGSFPPQPHLNNSFVPNGVSNNRPPANPVQLGTDPSLFFSQQTNTAARLPHNAGFPDELSMADPAYGVQLPTGAVPFQSFQGNATASTSNVYPPMVGQQQGYQDTSPGSYGSPNTGSSWGNLSNMPPMPNGNGTRATQSPEFIRPSAHVVQSQQNGVEQHPSYGSTTSLPHSVSSSSSASIPLAQASHVHGRRASMKTEQQQPQPRRKRRRQEDAVIHGVQEMGLGDDGGYSDDDSDGEQANASRATGGGLGRQPSEPKKPGACTHCKRLKMKCEFQPGATSCDRCVGKHECRVEGRKQRQKSNWREVLNQKLKEQERIIQRLVTQLHQPLHIPAFHGTSAVAVPKAYQPSAVDMPIGKSKPDIQTWVAEASAAGINPEPLLSPSSHSVTGSSKFHSEGEDSDNDSRDDDSDDDSPMKQGGMHALPTADSPFGLLADSSLRVHRGGSHRGSGSVISEQEDEEAVGVASAQFFEPGLGGIPSLRKIVIERQLPPEITERGIITAEEASQLFKIYFDNLNPVLALLDPAIHSAKRVYGRCPFLFTVVCAIAARYYTERPEVYPIAMHLARTSAATSLINGWKSVEICQAYIIMSVYSLPAKRWEEDRSWLYLGLAIRMATDLNLHIPTTAKNLNEAHEREVLNRLRTWQICFNLDRSAATQIGRPRSIQEDYIIRRSSTFYKLSNYNHEYDIHLCAYTDLLRITAGFMDDVYSDKDTPTGLNKNIDWLGVTQKHDEKLINFLNATKARFEVESKKDSPTCVYRTQLLPFLFQYARLVVWSFGFQHLFVSHTESPELKIFFERCFDGAYQVVNVAVNQLAKTPYWRYAPDGHYIFVAFACAFLLKLMRPEFEPLLTQGQQAQMLFMIRSAIDSLHNVAVDNMHTPRLYARFLQTLMERRQSIDEMEANEGEVGEQGVLPTTATGVVEPPTQGVTDEAPASGPSTQADGSGLGSHLTANIYTRSITPLVMVEGSVSGAVSTVGDDTEIGGASTYGGSLFNLDNVQEDAEFLASMGSLIDPAFSDTMMLPGFRWPAENSGMDWFNAVSQTGSGYSNPMQSASFNGL